MKEAKYSFNPCLFNECIYLCGCSRLIEAFSPQTDSFLPVRMALPESKACCLYVHNNLLVIHSKGYISRFTAGTASQLVQHSQTQSAQAVDKWPNSQPVLVPARHLFYFFQGYKCLCFHMETGEEVQRLA